MFCVLCEEKLGNLFCGVASWGRPESLEKHHVQSAIISAVLVDLK